MGLPISVPLRRAAGMVRMTLQVFRVPFNVNMTYLVDSELPLFTRTIAFAMCSLGNFTFSEIVDIIVLDRETGR